MAGLWDSIKEQAAPARDIANGGSEIVEDPVRGASVRVVRTEGLKFKPVNPDYQHVVVAVDEDDSETIEGTFTEEQAAPIAVEKPIDDFSDLIGDLSTIEEKPKETRGRPRKYASDAQRQLAYRLRNKKPAKVRGKRK